MIITNYFDQNKLSKVDTKDFDNKILTNQKIYGHEKIQLGKLLGGMEKPGARIFFESTISTYSKEFKNYFDQNRAEKYIKIQQSLLLNVKQNILLRSTFGIDVAPDKNSIELYKDKQDFTENCLKSTKNDHIFGQSKRFPIFKKAIEALKKNYEQWDTLDKTEDKENLKGLIQCQHQNLNKLSILMKEIAKNEADSSALSQCVPNNQINKFLTPFLQGDKVVSQKEVEGLKKELIQFINTSQKENPKCVTKNQLHQQRKESPISNVAINKEAELFKAVREGKLWAKTQDALLIKGNSNNTVIQLKNLDESETVAFYKEGSDKEKASGVMEKLMWDIAVIMKQEDSFVPTKEIDLRTKKELNSGDKEIVELDKNGELIKLSSVKEARQGGVQIAQKGNSFAENVSSINNPTHITKDQVIQGTLITLLFGMFDAHGGNFIVDKKGNCQFFDNTRSMVSSNGFIEWGGGIFPAYRSGLLYMKDSYETLSQKEITLITNRLSQSKYKMKDLRKFFDHPNTQAQLKKLPPGWMNVPDSLKAMEERISGMQKALHTNKIICLRDLVFSANPGYKFAAVMHILRHLPSSAKGISSDDKQKLLDTQRSFLPEVGFKSMNDLIVDCVGKSLDPQKIKDWCDDPNLSFEKVLSLATSYAAESTQNLSLQNYQDLKASSVYVLNELKKQAKLDLKDISRENIEKILKSKFMNACKEEHISIIKFTQVLEITLKKKALSPGDYFFIERTDLSNSTFKICYKNKKGEIRNEVIDIDSCPGKIKLGNDNLTFNDVCEVCINRI